MTQCRELENAHNEKLPDIAVVTLEKYMKNELEEELPEELRNVSFLFHHRQTHHTTSYLSFSIQNVLLYQRLLHLYRNVILKKLVADPSYI